MITLTGKIPPQSLDLEEAVIASILTDRDCLVISLTEISTSEIFYSQKHRIIFEACRNLFAVSKPVDILTVVNELRTLGSLESVGGAIAIANLTDNSNSWFNVKSHLLILKQKWIRRMLISLCQKNISLAYNDTFDEFELLEKSSLEILKINEMLSVKKTETGKQIYLKAFQEIAQAMLNPGKTGLPSGILELDQVTGGWQSPDLIIVAGRPGMGKTAFAISATKNIFLEQNRKVLIFSLEMTSTQLMHRLIASEGEISGAKLKKGYISQSEYISLQTSTTKLYTDNLIIDDTAGIGIGQLRAKAIAEKMKDKDLAIVIVDYLQLMKGASRGQNREREVSEISSGLKNLAKELNVPVIALCQLSRAVEGRAVKKPQLSDLRESGSIEQDADSVLFISRPDYYGVKEYEDGTSTEGTAEIIVGKNRHGATSEIIVGYEAAKFSFHSKDLNPFQKHVSKINTVQNNFENKENVNIF